MTSVSDSVPTRAERDHTVDRLQEAVSNGELTLDEFQARLDAAYAVNARAELASLIADLPLHSPSTTTKYLSPQKRLVVGAAAIAVALLAAAGAAIGVEHQSSDDPTPNASIARAVDSCALLPTTQVDAVLGTASVKPPDRTQLSDGTDECSYLTTSGNGPAVDVQAGTAISQFATRYKITNGDVAGIGSQAAIYTNLPGAAILARQGSEWVEVYVEYLPVSAATSDAETLARAALHQVTNQ